MNYKLYDERKLCNDLAVTLAPHISAKRLAKRQVIAPKERMLICTLILHVAMDF
jgi:hypothetical protein